MRAFVAALAAVAVQAEVIPDTTFRHLILEHKQYVNSNYTPIDITVDGKKTTKYIASDWCTSDGGSFTCNMNNRGFIIDSPTFDKATPNFFAPNLLGGSVEWDVDMSQHECGCFNTFYTVKMPAKVQDGSLWNTDGYFYCDANVGNHGGAFCPEFDLQEGSKYSFATTPHMCSLPNAQGHYDWCDGSGQCALNIVDMLDWNGYGPGEQYTINTDLPFHVKVSFEQDESGNLAGYSTQMTQNGRSQTMHSGYCDYLHNMTADLANGMAFVVSNWEGDDSWLRKDRCSGQCPGDAVETIKNISIKTGKAKVEEVRKAPYKPKDFEFGNSCHSAHDGYCYSQGCKTASHCRWSWPANDLYKGHSPYAACRCDNGV